MIQGDIAQMYKMKKRNGTPQRMFSKDYRLYSLVRGFIGSLKVPERSSAVKSRCG
jgi:hypothetical protein